MKRILQWLAAGIVILLLMPVCIVTLLYLPVTQQIGREWAIHQLSELSGLNIQASEVRLRWPLRIEASDVQIDSLLAVEHVDTHIRLRPLLKGQVIAHHLTLEGVTLHTDTLITSLRIDGDIRRLHLSNIHYAWREWHLAVGDIDLAGCSMALTRQQGEARTKDEKKTLPLTLHIGHTSLDESTINYKDAAREWHLTEIAMHIDSIRHSPIATSAVLTSLTFIEERGITLREGALTLLLTKDMVEFPHLSFHTDESSLTGYTRLTNGGRIEGTLAATIGHTDVTDLLKIFAPLNSTISEVSTILGTSESTPPLRVALAINGTPDTLHVQQCEISWASILDIAIDGDILAINDSQQRRASLSFDARTWESGALATVLETPVAIPDSIALRGTVDYAADTLHTQLLLHIHDGSIALDGGYRPSTQSYSLTAATRTLDMRQLWPQGSLHTATLRTTITGKGLDLQDNSTSIDARLHIDSLQWDKHALTNATVHATLDDRQLHTAISYADTLIRLQLNGTARFTDENIEAHLHANVADIDLKGLQLTSEELHPTFLCNLTLHASPTYYSLHGRMYGITLTTPTRTTNPQDLALHLDLSADSLALGMQSSDLQLAIRAHTQGFPWQWQLPADTAAVTYTHYLSGIVAELSVGTDNPVSHYLSLIGIDYDTIQGSLREAHHGLAAQVTVNGFSAKGISARNTSLTAHYTEGVVHAKVQSERLDWSTSTMRLSTSLQATAVWADDFTPDNLSGTLTLTDLHYTLPTYSLQLQARDTLAIPFRKGRFTLTDLPLYPGSSKQPLTLNGHIALLHTTPTLHLTLRAQGADLLQRRTAQSILYGSALVSGEVAIDGPYDALSLTGNLKLRTGSYIHYIYKDAILTSGNQLDNVITFTDFAQQERAATPTVVRHYASYGFSMDLNIDIDPTVQLEVLLGGSGQNTGNLQGGGNLNLQYIPASGLRLSGKYTIESGTLNMNIPLLHVHQMNIRPGSTVQWSGNATNPMLNIVAEDRIRASVTLDGSPQSVLFLTGITLTDTMNKLGLQFTLTAPESASMQNTLAALSPDERSKLAVALLTTGLYLGEGGTGNLMNTALMGFLQSQLDNISRDAFRTVDVSVGIEPLQDGVSGVSTRTDYSFSIAKRLWNDRIRIVIGGSVTTSNERIESDDIINNISIEWRIVPNGSQYLRFFYDKNYESILEGEIRETGVGYAYRRQLRKLKL
ncbi:MAG: translocation/assembly module TamB domain-containing protein [Bacteroidaceae bacterium]|nr:translocation/assembly module TamB domain-containing protein [Bacteroidaceae bacterium]